MVLIFQTNDKAQENIYSSFVFRPGCFPFQRQTGFSHVKKGWKKDEFHLLAWVMESVMTP